MVATGGDMLLSVLLTQRCSERKGYPKLHSHCDTADQHESGHQSAVEALIGRVVSSGGAPAHGEQDPSPVPHTQDLNGPGKHKCVTSGSKGGIGAKAQPTEQAECRSNGRKRWWANGAVGSTARDFSFLTVAFVCVAKSAL